MSRMGIVMEPEEPALDVDAAISGKRPATDFGAPGVVSHFHGPFADGPPARALHVDTPSIDRFGYAELKRMVVIYLTLTVCIVRALAQKIVRQRKGSWATVASEGAIDGFEVLGPTFVKLGQLIASSPGIFPAPLSNAALRCLDEVPPFDGATAREMIRKDLGRAPSQTIREDLRRFKQLLEVSK